MSTPRTKRPYAGAASDPSQSQITSFFGPGQPSISVTSHSPSDTAPSPVLPASVQANLLSVGMRVRKSVPEGYKTGGYNAFKLWSDSDNAAASSKPKYTPAPIVTQKELLPFCGINRVGGLSSQPSFAEDDDLPSMDAMPGLTSSQESMASTASAQSDNTSTRKRIFDEEDRSEQPVHVWMDRDAWLDGEISPRSLAPAGWGNARVMAVPRKHRPKRTIGIGNSDMGQENMLVDDFEDAEFLDYRSCAKDMDMNDA
jgi:hypothetical protein